MKLIKPLQLFPLLVSHLTSKKLIKKEVFSSPGVFQFKQLKNIKCRSTFDLLRIIANFFESKGFVVSGTMDDLKLKKLIRRKRKKATWEEIGRVSISPLFSEDGVIWTIYINDYEIY